MLKILVVDDNSVKQQKIRDVLTSIEMISDDDITVASDIISAKRELQERTFDLMLLDIQVPNRFDQAAKIDGGISLIRELMVSKRYNLPNNIIGITAHEDLYEEVKRTFEEMLLYVIKYEVNSDSWSNSLRVRVEHLIATKKNSTQGYNVKYDYDLAIICALDKVELEGVKQVSEGWEHVPIPQDESTNYYQCKFTNGNKTIRVIAAACAQMGMTASSVLAMKMIQLFTPKYLVMTGIAAGIRGKVEIGDILVADQSWDYGSGKIINELGEDVLLPDPNPIRLSPSIKTKIQLLASDGIALKTIQDGWQGDRVKTVLNMHIGPVASGAAVIANSKTVNSIMRHNRRIIGIEMENYGVYYASQHCPSPQPRCFSLKSVCDFADEEKNDSAQRYASYTSAATLRELALHYLDFDFD